MTSAREPWRGHGDVCVTALMKRPLMKLIEPPHHQKGGKEVRSKIISRILRCCCVDHTPRRCAVMSLVGADSANTSDDYSENIDDILDSGQSSPYPSRTSIASSIIVTRTVGVVQRQHAQTHKHSLRVLLFAVSTHHGWMT